MSFLPQLPLRSLLGWLRRFGSPPTANTPTSHLTGHELPFGEGFVDYRRTIRRDIFLTPSIENSNNRLVAK